MIGAATHPRGARIARQLWADLASVRVTGTLTTDADVAATVGQDPHVLLILDFAPPHGLPYHARIDLGTDVADHMQAEGYLPYLRTGALVSVAGDALEMRTDHGHAALRVVRARALVIPCDPIPQPQQEG
jgi:hypothetical protein